MPYRKAVEMSVSTRTEELSPEELDDAIREWVEKHVGVPLGEIQAGHKKTCITYPDDEHCGAEVTWVIHTLAKT